MSGEEEFASGIAPAFSISIARSEDIEALIKLVNSAYRGETAKKGWTTEADLLTGIRTDDTLLLEMMKKPGAVILKYCNDKEELTGCVYLQPQENKLYLGMLTVSPECQAHGIGKKLLAASENYARENGFDAIKMSVIRVRHELIAWYERHGYRRTGETKPFPKDTRYGIPKQPLDFIVLEKIM